MVQFVSGEDIVDHQEEVVSIVSYPVLLIPMLIRHSMQIFVRNKLINNIMITGVAVIIIPPNHDYFPQ